ncbi:hypothetical protein B0A52_07461 [Exophiala mesophila]|uniref:Major facilitator superfamily (MFS) profile domain-containing protein n=1 Tax=Exophiala mesophila TaxID=212818 RepID=A0A438MXI9_EXOME|nr:hypothetical protein B0A52_07461 [Exophiala mesophila]
MGLPTLYLPSYLNDISLGVTKGAFLLTLMSISQVAGQFIFGYLSDQKLSLNMLMTVCLSMAAAATFGTWGGALSMLPLVAFALLYGFFGAGYTAMWARMVTTVSSEPSSYPAMFSLFCFGKGVGNVLVGPIGSLLLRPARNDNGYAHGTYKLVVVFTGVCLLSGALILAARNFRFK